MASPYETLSNGIRISVVPVFSEENSKIEASVYVYTYTISITNERSDHVQLLSRHWTIKDGFNRVEEVVGEGVIGQKPRLRPGETFTYTSFCPLSTPSGSMKGIFHMQNSDKQDFDVNIDEFFFRHAALVN